MNVRILKLEVINVSDRFKYSNIYNIISWYFHRINCDIFLNKRCFTFINCWTFLLGYVYKNFMWFVIFCCNHIHSFINFCTIKITTNCNSLTNSIKMLVHKDLVIFYSIPIFTQNTSEIYPYIILMNFTIKNYYFFLVNEFKILQFIK